jgi:predicted house-cleaning NTP pyrophosphatase (Maf/HAM1 superfamily)
MERYVATGSPLDKAGAYGIQDGFPLVKEYVGSYDNVVGFPTELMKSLLIEEGVL